MAEKREVSAPGSSSSADKATEVQFAIERYKYILGQINTVNENVYRFLAIYQTLAVTLVSGALVLFVGYRKWGIHPSTARVGIIGLLSLTTVIAGFVIMLIIAGLRSWLDYRREECSLTDAIVKPGFRDPP